MKQKDIVFVGGIHGVGKSTLCNKLKSILNINHHSASELIKKKNQDLVNSSKTVNDVSGNQDILIQAINEYVTDNKFLLDGHFALFNSSKEVIEIPLKTFEGLAPKVIILLVDQVESIVDRIEARDNIRHSLTSYKQLDDAERRLAVHVAETLAIPIYVHNMAGNLDELISFIKNI